MELGKSDLLKRLREAFSAMMGTLHKQKGASLDIQIMADPSVTDFIEQHSSVLDSAIQQQPMSDGMRNRLQRSNYIFSGMKTFHELNEAFPSLLDENGNRKPFEQFLNEVQNIDSKYNSNYLRAEYNFVQASAEMAAKWEQFMEDGDRYYLQYRTQKDDKVRPEHAALDGVTLPPSDSFWEEYYPPNGWNCRCTVVQVRKSKYPATPHDEAMARGQVALDKDTRGIFHFNPGIEQKTVPDYNPYTIKRCRDCDISSKLAGYIPDNEVCAACKLVHKCYENKTVGNEIKQNKERNKELYDKMKIDKEFRFVEYNEETGGIKAESIHHNSTSKGDKFFTNENNGKGYSGPELEKFCQDELYMKGHSCILMGENLPKGDGTFLTALDAIIDCHRMDIRTITENSDNYRNQITSKNKQLKKWLEQNPNSSEDSVCLYFHDSSMFSEQKMNNTISAIRNSQRIMSTLKINRIVCVVRQGPIKEYRIR